MRNVQSQIVFLPGHHWKFQTENYTAFSSDYTIKLATFCTKFAQSYLTPSYKITRVTRNAGGEKRLRGLDRGAVRGRNSPDFYKNNRVSLKNSR